MEWPGTNTGGHSGSKRLKSAENRFTQSDYTSFSVQVSANSYNFPFRQYSKFDKSLYNKEIGDKDYQNFNFLFYLGWSGCKHNIMKVVQS